MIATPASELTPVSSIRDLKPHANFLTRSHTLPYSCQWNASLSLCCALAELRRPHRGFGAWNSNARSNVDSNDTPHGGSAFTLRFVT